jgi:hypothetical protein
LLVSQRKDYNNAQVKDALKEKLKWEKSKLNEI